MHLKNHRTKEQDEVAGRIVRALMDAGWGESPMGQYGDWYLVGNSLILVYQDDEDGWHKACEYRMEHGTVVAKMLDSLCAEALGEGYEDSVDGAYDYVPVTAPTLEYLDATLPLADSVTKEADAHYYDFSNGMTFVMGLKPEYRDRWEEDAAPGGYWVYETLTPLHTPLPDGELDVVEAVGEVVQ